MLTRSTIFAVVLGAAFGCAPRGGDYPTMREAQVQNTPAYQAAQADPQVDPDDPDNRTLPSEDYLEDYRRPLPTTPLPQDGFDDDVDDADRYYVPRQPTPSVDRDDDHDDAYDYDDADDAYDYDDDTDDAYDDDDDAPDIEIHGEATTPGVEVQPQAQPPTDQVPDVPRDTEVPTDIDTPDPW